MTSNFPFQAGDDVRLVADPAHRSAVVEVLGQLAELRNGIRYSAAELRADPEPDEQWLALPGYDGRYLLSSHGKLLATDYQRAGRARLFAQSRSRPGVVISYALPSPLAGGKAGRRTAGQLVAENFIGPPPAPHWQVGYRDGDRTNLRAANLFWFNPRREGDRRTDAVNKYLGRTTVLSAAQARQVLGELDGKLAFNEARTAGPSRTNASIALAYGVSEEVIKSLAKNAGRAQRRPTSGVKDRILADLRGGVPRRQIAAAYNLSRTTVWRLAQEPAT